MYSLHLRLHTLRIVTLTITRKYYLIRLPSFSYYFQQIRVDALVPILSNKRKLMIGIILVRVPVGFIVRASFLKLFRCRSMQSDFLGFLTTTTLQEEYE